MIVILLIIVVGLGLATLIKSLGGDMVQSSATFSVNVTSSAGVQRLAQAIAFAEGFYVSGSRPARNHNPGDMTADLIGRGVGMDGSFIVYASDADGWANLYAQINLWLTGGSAHATAASTIDDLSQFYTTTDQTAWAANVANHLGVSLDTPIGQVS